MKLRIEDIRAQVKELNFPEPQAEINRVLERGPVREYHVEGPLEVRISYYRAGMDLFFEGRLDAHLTVLCARCAEEFPTTYRRDFRFVLTPQAADGARGDLALEDLELSTYNGEEVDLSPLIREQFLLALPTRPLCGEECRGLCPQCGVNLNLVACDCGRNHPDPRLEALRSLKITRS